MIIRTYQRRSRGNVNGNGNGVSDSTGEDGSYFRDSSSQDPPWSSSQESPFLTNPSSQDSSYWSHLDFPSASASDRCYGKDKGGTGYAAVATSSRHRSLSEPVGAKKHEDAGILGKKQRGQSSMAPDNGNFKRPKIELESFGAGTEAGKHRLDWMEGFRTRYGPLAPPTSTLMEAQESGEMMEHFDEANFAMDGLKPGQPLRVQRASMSSILSLCGSLQQRRLLRSHGLARPLLDAIVTLPVHDPSLALAAAAVLFFLAMDGQDEDLLSSTTCIHFLLKLLSSEPQAHTAENASSFGTRLASLSSKLNFSKANTGSTGLDQGGAVVAKVKLLFASLKEKTAREGMQAEEQEQFSGDDLSYRWLALLTLEKACLSTVILEDTAGTVKKAGGQFKETLRELGGLNAISDLAAECLLNLKDLLENGDPKSNSRVPVLNNFEQFRGVSMLLRCLRVMENVTFLSEDNQRHLLELKLVKGKSQSSDSFINLILSAIKVCYDLMQTFKRKREVPETTGGPGQTLHIGCEARDPSIDLEQKRVRANLYKDKLSRDLKGHQKDKMKSVAGHSALSASVKGNISMAEPLDPIDPEATSESFQFSLQLGSKSNRSKKVSESVDLEDSQDPYAFNEDFGFEANKQNKRTSKRRKPEKHILSAKVVHECAANRITRDLSREPQGADTTSLSASTMVSQESTVLLEDVESGKYVPFAECLLSAVKVLMNLTNDNPNGCCQVAACGGLDTMAMLVLGCCEKQKIVSKILKENFVERVSFEGDLDLLVAVLGVLVNLIEKDDRNRARLATLNVSVASSSNVKESREPYRGDLISVLCLLFLSKQGAGEAAEAKEAKMQLEMDHEADFRQGQREAEDMIVEAYAALLLAFLSRESEHVRSAISKFLPGEGLCALVPVLERFVDFHLSLNMLSAETHDAVRCVIDSCKQPLKEAEKL